MITRWMITGKPKSKGFYKNMQRNHIVSINQFLSQPIKEYETIARFTKQMALAKNYMTKEEAEKAYNDMILKYEEKILNAKERIPVIEDFKNKWNSLTDLERVNFLAEYPIRIEREKEVSRRYNDSISYIHLREMLNSPTLNFSGSYYCSANDLKLIKEFTRFDEIQNALNRFISHMEKNIKYVKENLMIVETELVLKQYKGDMGRVEWEYRNHEHTSWGACVKCGYVIPDVDYLRICGRRNNIYICIMCMEKLIAESKQRLTNLNDEMKETYTTTTFLNAI